MINSFKKLSCMIVGSATVLVTLEILLSFFQVSYPTDLSPGFGAGEAALHKPGQAFTYSRDWDFHLSRHGKINEHGFHGHCEPKSGSTDNIFIMGDSYTEALMLPPERSLGKKVAEAMPNLGLCAAGMSGAPASEYLSQLDHLSKKWQASTLVFAINRTDFLESFDPREGIAKFTTEENAESLAGGSFQRVSFIAKMYTSSAFRYIYYNLDLKRTFERLKNSLPFKRKHAQSATQDNLEKLAIEKFLNGLEKRKLPNQKVVFIVNDTIRNKGNTQDAQDVGFWENFLQTADSSGYLSIRTSNVFSKGHCDSQSCYLFRDGHWSAAGHAEIAAALRVVIEQANRSQ